MSKLAEVLRLMAAGTIPRDIPPDCEAREELAQLAAYLSELTAYVRAVSAGDLSARLELKGPLAGALKALHSDLRHLTWQTQQVAAGDFTQRVEFLGDFSAAFNSMVAALAQSREQLVAKNDQLVKAYEELKAAEVQLLQQEKMASVGQLAAGIAHEINNPIGFVLSNLGTMKSYSEALRGHLQLLDEIATRGAEADRAAAEVSRRERDLDFVFSDLPVLIGESIDGIRRVQAIVANLKGFSQVDAVGVQTVDLNECIESTVKAAAGILGVRITVLRDYGEGCVIECFAQELGEMFMNLLLNAAEAISAEGQIRIATRRAGATVVVTIEDTGRGIPAEIIGRVFEPFFTTKPVGKNRGLGLAMVYQTVTRHHGATGVESTVGQGTRFSLRLPCRLGDHATSSAGA
jgi:signal transduction histidine kinase